ncbi:hypothetical protein COT70_00265 [candidate division WWE3 bacterium CG09_land_8_20_14_0_10_47_33]|uniref:Uncharacterized protein n=1 Tax=candidate division WWE3 bacterium CG_4_9_14_0_2_um_filter_48_10 TaxID=1975078 RepID=A0A2M8EKI0_UNCKA|nr:MAG: hypothetical protein COT70_00265 [candidate division WWE3 bacterium CG09_land_8_20_14_0_10_47_33]PIZ41502.1 MAG: hypothetical protein COY35_00285 [candidate division WWE3 bacterium CG_4_10_14_0_2_um_filter_47_8]PJC23197.1 MAG: hypothetical protein CO059_00235 [candidate division WWE3 bacterium CG_4_9_14_0_2_um_filter_48_10]PJE52021.1 MAG: hypothetical protein COV28_01170 [candidate division WWE3 bacterium CG10_big_fil_rev_8_21_14_0_10_48_23]
MSIVVFLSRSSKRSKGINGKVAVFGDGLEVLTIPITLDYPPSFYIFLPPPLPPLFLAKISYQKFRARIFFSKILRS